MRVLTVLLVLTLVTATAFAAYRHLRRNSYSALMNAAEEFYLEAQYEPAYEAYQDVAARYPGKTEPLQGAAHSAERAGQLEDAVRAYRSILSVTPRFPSEAALPLTLVLYETGRLYSLLKLWDKAVESFRGSVEADSANYTAHFALGGALEEQGKLAEALTAYRNALGVSPSSETAQDAVKRVSQLLSPPPPLKAAEDAKRKYDEAVRGGIAALERKSYRDASQFFAEALAVRSDDADAWVGFADARAELGDAPGAIKSLERALEREPNHVAAKSRLDELRKERK
jgi:tetratricopeptide (TPR) repeat protein